MEYFYSILIPAFKAKYLSATINSCLCQSYSNFEIIIVDDASPEDILGVVKSFNDERIHYYRNKANCGAVNVVDNWNICLDYANGDYVICMGDDDLLASCCLEDYNSIINKYPGLNVYHTRTLLIDDSSNAPLNYILRKDLIDFIMAFLEESATPPNGIIEISSVLLPSTILDSIIATMNKLYEDVIDEENYKYKKEKDEKKKIRMKKKI